MRRDESRGLSRGTGPGIRMARPSTRGSAREGKGWHLEPRKKMAGCHHSRDGTSCLGNGFGDRLWRAEEQLRRTGQAIARVSSDI